MGVRGRALLWPTEVPDDLTLPELDQRAFFTPAAARGGARLRALPAHQRRCSSTVVLLVVLGDLRAPRRALHARVGRRSHRHRDAARDAGLRVRLARPAPVRRRGSSGGSAATTSPKQGYLEVVTEQLPRLGGVVPLRLRGDRDRDGARAAAAEPLVDPGRARVRRRSALLLHVRRSRILLADLSKPLKRPARRGGAAAGARAGRRRDPGQGRRRGRSSPTRRTRWRSASARRGA